MRPNNSYPKNDVTINSLSASSLTKGQTDCLYHLVLGMTAKEIAKELLLYPRTVEHYLDNIRLKLDCHSRSDLVNKAIKLTAIKTKLLL